jgi:hypothetical protein
MTKPKYVPCRITAFAEKAHLVRQVAAAQGVEYDETPIPDNNLIDFSFKKLDRVRSDRLVLAMPREAFAKRAIMGLEGLDPATLKEVITSISALRGADLDADVVKQLIKEARAGAKKE